MCHTDFQIAGGGVIGRDHRQKSLNYQDSYLIKRTDNYSLAIVADGCSSGKHSEVGAITGLKMLAKAIDKQTAQKGMADFNWSDVQHQVLAALNLFAEYQDGSYVQTVLEQFLFTINGVLITDELATFFALGDGIIVVNNQIINLGPFPGNAPPYLGHGLIPYWAKLDPSIIRLQPVLEKPICELDHFLIGSDGVDDFVMAADKTLPGLSDRCGDISQFWEQDRYFKGNPDLVSRTLRIAGRDWPKRDPEPGLLPDDTTLVVGRRQPSERGDENEFCLCTGQKSSPSS